MNLVLGALYVALRSAGASDEQAEAAVAEVAGFGGRPDSIDAELKLLRRILIYLLYAPEEFQETKPIFLDFVEDAVLCSMTMESRGPSWVSSAQMEALGSRKIVLDDGAYD
ncbi:MAG: hypothetical protein AB7F94_02220 [Nitrospira sp.]